VGRGWRRGGGGGGEEVGGWWWGWGVPPWIAGKTRNNAQEKTQKNVRRRKGIFAASGLENNNTGQRGHRGLQKDGKKKSESLDHEGCKRGTEHHNCELDRIKGKKTPRLKERGGRMDQRPVR